MENLENIVFDRFCDFLEKHGIEIKYVNAKYFGSKRYRLYVNNEVISSTSWSSKHNFLFGDKDNEHNFAYFDESIFNISETFTMLDNNILSFGESKLAELWPILRQFQADSLEEMLIKMDLTGV